MTYENKKVKVGVRDIGEIIELFDQVSNRFRAFNVLSKNVILNVSQGTYELEAGIEVKKGRPFSRKLTLPIFNSLNVQLTGLPSFTSFDDVVKTSEDEGIMLSLGKIPKNVDTLLLNIKCPLKHRRFLERLVYKKVQIEPRKNITSYWMSAQFKHLDTLRKKLNAIRVDDLDFMVRVHIQENIKELIPHTFIRQLEVGKELLQTRDRVMKDRLARDHLRLARTNVLVGKEEEIIEKIEDLLKPNNFELYLKVLGSFYYHDCFHGGHFFRIPNFVIPSMMRVITKTNLTLEEPATKGELQFDRGTFENNFEEIFPKKKKKRRKF